jgi:hypothetical protein
VEEQYRKHTTPREPGTLLDALLAFLVCCSVAISVIALTATYQTKKQIGDVNLAYMLGQAVACLFFICLTVALRAGYRRWWFNRHRGSINFGATIEVSDDRGKQYYFLADKQKQGPVSAEALKAKLRGGELSGETMTWTPGYSSWVKLSELSEFFTPPSLPDHQGRPVSNTGLKAEPESLSRRDIAASRRGFVVRYWSGEIALWKSYWLVGTFVTAFVMAAVASIETVDWESGRGYASSRLVLLVTGYILTVWHMVGLWRSAEVYQRRKPTVSWGELVKFGVVIGALGLVGRTLTNVIPQSRELWAIAVQGETIAPYTISVLNHGTEIEIKGGLRFGISSEVERHLNANPALRLVHLNSPGGRIIEATKLYALIKARGLSTYTSLGCASACSFAFLAGAERMKTETAQLGFHSAFFPGASDEDQRAMNETIRSILAQAGLAQQFVEKVISTRPDSMWYPTSEELKQFGIVTAVTNGKTFAMTDVRRGFESPGFEAELRKEPIFQILSKYEPDAYKSVLESMRQSAALGYSTVEMRKSTLPVISKVYQRALPHADDLSLKSYGTLQAKRLKWFADKAEWRKCAALETRSADFDEAIFALPVVLQSEELSITAKVIESSYTNPGQKVSTKHFQDDMAAIVDTLSRQAGIDLSVLATPPAKIRDFKGYCTASLAFYQEALQLPLPRFGNFMRAVFSSNTGSQ